MTFELPGIVAKHIRHFTGRAWLLTPLLKWLEEPDNRIFVFMRL
jgi:hypothetical protein